MAAQIERDGARKMSGEDQMMFQDHVHPFVDKVSRGDSECLPPPVSSNLVYSESQYRVELELRCTYLPGQRLGPQRACSVLG